MKLVFIQNNRLVTDSLLVAQTFGKRHDNVLRDIKELECSREFSLLNFEESSYTAGNGQTYPKYLITQDGFSFLAFGYTGKEAARYKEMYIAEFNRMREELNKPQFALPLTHIEAVESYLGELKKNETLAIENKSLELKIAADRPKVVFAESLEVSNDTILIGQLAKILKQNGIDLGQNRLFEILREDGYLMKIGERRNQPTQRTMELGLMMVKIGTRSSSSEGTKNTYTTKVTGKGIMYFINKFKQSQSA